MGLGAKIILTGLLFWAISSVLIELIKGLNDESILNVLVVIWYASAAITIVGALIAIWV